MAKLRGVMQAYGGNEVSRLSHREIVTSLHTWEGKVEVSLYDGGIFNVRLNGQTILTGNVGNGEEAYAEFLGA